MSRVKFASAICILAFACMGVGCASSTGDDQAVVDGGPDAPSGPQLSLRFWVPEESEAVPVNVASDDVNTLCFDATSNVDVEFRRLPLEFRSDQAPISDPPVTGLVYRGKVQYRDIKVQSGGQVVSEPAELSAAESDPTQHVDLRDTFVVRASDQPTLFCVQLDVNNESAIVGNGLSIKLLPFEPGDVVLAADGSDLPIENIERLDEDRQPLPIPEIDLTIRGVQCFSTQISRPSVTEAPLPTSRLDYGDIVSYSETITAPPDQGLLVWWRSYKVHVFTPDPEVTILGSPRLSIANGSDLAAEAWIETFGGGCNFVASWAYRCVRVRLANPIWIAPGRSKDFHLRMTVSGTLVDGELLTTSSVMDAFGGQVGILTDGRIDAMYPNNVMMSNDGVCWFNGYYVRWGTPFSQVLGYHDP